MEAPISAIPNRNIKLDELKKTLGECEFAINANEQTLTDVLISELPEVARIVHTILNEHLRAPFDLVIGDDVSGRVPTLIVHKVMRLAHDAGLVTSSPPTRFITSGSVPIDRIFNQVFVDGSDYNDPELKKKYANNLSKFKSEWSENIRKHAEILMGRIAVKKALIVTEFVSSGRSIERIAIPFLKKGVAVRCAQIAPLLYTADYEREDDEGENEERLIVGVEKNGTSAVSKRYPYISKEQKQKYVTMSRDFRQFLDAYSVAIFDIIRSNSVEGDSDIWDLTQRLDNISWTMC